MHIHTYMHTCIHAYIHTYMHKVREKEAIHMEGLERSSSRMVAQKPPDHGQWHQESRQEEEAIDKLHPASKTVPIRGFWGFRGFRAWGGLGGLGSWSRKVTSVRLPADGRGRKLQVARSEKV